MRSHLVYQTLNIIFSVVALGQVMEAIRKLTSHMFNFDITLSIYNETHVQGVRQIEMILHVEAIYILRNYKPISCLCQKGFLW